MKPLANTLALGAVATLALTSATPAQEITMEQATPFEIAIPDATITDLRQRINATRFPDQIEGSGHDYGMDTQYLRGVLEYWANDYDWRAEEARLNAFDHFYRNAFLTNLTVYWATETINPSMRLYYETFRDQGGWGTPDVPVGYLMPINDLFPTPRSWVERQGPVSHWTESAVGGHFMEWEEPEVVADDLRAFFATIE